MLRAGHGLIIVVASLLTIGIVMVSSAGLSVGAANPLGLEDILLGRNAIFAAMAVILMLAASWIPVSTLYRLRGIASPMPWIVLVSVVLLLLVHLPGLGHEVNGARRWIRIGPIGFQPSEIVKWGLLFVIAWHTSRRAGSMGRFGTGFLTPMALIGLVCVLIGTEDLGTAMLIGVAGVAVLFAAGARLWHAFLLIPLGVTGFVAAVITSPYRIARLQAFLDPYADPCGIGYHVIQSMGAVSGGGLAGRGLGNGLQKFGYLPEDTTDFIFAVICEELGVAGACIVVGLYAILLLCGFCIVRRAAHPFHRLLGLGILLTIGFQALINMFVVTGLAPTKGIALPLVSSGGTGWCLTALCIGFLISMDREQAREEIALLAEDRPGRLPAGSAGRAPLLLPGS